MTTKNKILAQILAITLIIVAVFFYLAASSKGFPDGHLTELDSAEQPLFYISAVLSLLAGLFLLYLALFNKISDANKTFYGTMIFLFLLGMILGGLEWYFIETLENGVGG